MASKFCTDISVLKVMAGIGIDSNTLSEKLVGFGFDDESGVSTSLKKDSDGFDVEGFDVEGFYDMYDSDEIDKEMVEEKVVKKLDQF